MRLSCPCLRKEKDVQSQRYFVMHVYTWIPLVVLEMTALQRESEALPNKKTKQFVAPDTVMLLIIMRLVDNVGITRFGLVVLRTQELHGMV